MTSVAPAAASLRRRLLSVTRTVFVNGSACSSHTCSSSRSALCTSFGVKEEPAQERVLLRVQVDGAQCRCAPRAGRRPA